MFVVVHFPKPGYNRSKPNGEFVKVRAKTAKSRSTVKVADRLCSVLETFALIHLNRTSGNVEVNDVWFAAVTRVLRLCALRLAFRTETWNELLEKHAADLESLEWGGGDLNESHVVALSALDEVLESLNRDRAEETISLVYEMVLNMVPVLKHTEIGVQEIGDKNFSDQKLSALKFTEKKFGDPEIDQEIDVQETSIQETGVEKISVEEIDVKRFSVKRLDKVKKRSGSFYSPKDLVEYTVEKALGPIISALRSNENSYSASDDRSLLSQILNLKIVDPSMGGGVFLVQAFRYLVAAVPKGTTDAEKIQIARDCIFGVDLDPLAVEVARLSLWLAVKEYLSHGSFVQDFPNLRVGNSLIGARIDRCNSPPLSPRRLSLQNPSPQPNRPQSLSSGGSSCVDLKNALDVWCAEKFVDRGSADSTVADANESDENLKNEHLFALASGSKFFHWEFEFPQVFDASINETPGFDAVIGNPPWEIAKPNSREFFGMVDPNYWSLGKQDAIAAQKRLLASDPQLLKSWNTLQHQHKQFASWVRTAPVQLNDSPHAFAYQGSGDLNLYKLFCEQSFYLAKKGGTIALIVPSGLYSDSGARELRRLLLEKTVWTHLTVFDNANSIFDIHRSFKFCIFFANKGGRTERIEMSSRGRSFEYGSGMIKTLSPKWSVLSEVENKETLSLLERIYQNSNLLGDTEYSGYRLEYAREFDMTMDSHQFQLRDRLQTDSYVQDAYGNWLSGKWHSRRKAHGVTDGVSTSACDNLQIAIEDISDVYVPLYEGRMVGQFNANEKHWVSGKGRRAVWQPCSSDFFGPQYLINKNAYAHRDPQFELKVGFLAVGCATNARTMIASCLSAVACGNSVPILRFRTVSNGAGFTVYESVKNTDNRSDSNSDDDADHGSASHVSIDPPLLLGDETAHGSPRPELTMNELQLALTACLNSFVFDFVIRRKMAGNNLNYFVIEECPLPKLTGTNLPLFRQLAKIVVQLNFRHLRFSRELNQLGYTSHPSTTVDSAQFRILRSYIDVLVAYLYGLDHQDLALILSDTLIGSEELNVKSFFRVDRNLDSEERLPALVLKHAAELEQNGIESMVQCIDALISLEQMGFERDANSRGQMIVHAKNLSDILNLSAQ
ncbi:MAG: DNA methyltransferase [Candidatus Melainabacteria bacterium]|nr:DNA methyltransferase [Candidatus Melainabacteria bacterium]